MKKPILASVALFAALALSACGTSEPSGGATASRSAGIELEDASGTKVTLDAPATKVVGTEWNVVENLVSLGVNPVGVADVPGYSAWAAAVPLKNEPKDIGTRGEPSVDTVAALAPDLIVATTDLPAAAVEQLRKIAPVLQVRSANGAGQIAQMNTNLDLIAEATGTETKATEVKAAYTDAITKGREALTAAGVAGSKVAFADGYAQGNQVGIRPYVKGSLIGDVNAELGLESAWTLEGDADYGLASTDVEGLTSLGDAKFLYITNKVDGDPFADVLAANPIWQSLPFVTAGNVKRLPDGIWMFGGPASMTAYANAAVSALTK